MSPESAIAALPRGTVAVATADAQRSSGWVVFVGCAMLLGGVIAFTVDLRLGVLALGLPLAPLFVLAPEKALLMMILVLPIDAISGLAPGATVSLSRLLGIAVLGGWIVHVLIRRERVQLDIAGWVLLAYVVFGAISALWAEDPALTFRRLRTIVQLFLFYVMASNILRRPDAIERAIDVLLGATAVVAMVVIRQFPSVEAFERATLTLGDEAMNANYLAASLVIPALAAVALGRARGRFGWWRFAALVPIGVAAIITGSRGAILSLVAGLTVIGIARPRVGIRAIGAGVTIVAALLLVAPQSYVYRLTERFSHAGQDRLSGRLDIWKVGIAMFEDHPIHGTGLAGFQPAFYRYMAEANIDPTWAIRNSWGLRAPHNVYLNAFAELGIIGGALLVSALLLHAVGVLRVFRARWSQPVVRGDVALALLAMVIGTLFIGMSTEIVATKLTWFVLALAQASVLAASATHSERTTSHS